MVKIEVVGISIWWGFGLVDIELMPLASSSGLGLSQGTALTGR